MKTEMRFVKLLHTTYRSALNAVFSTPVHKPGTGVHLSFVVGGFFLCHGAKNHNRRIAFFLCIVGYFTGPIGRLVGANVQIQNALIAADRLFEIMDLENEVKGQTSLTKVQLGDIVFKKFPSAMEVARKFLISSPHVFLLVR